MYKTGIIIELREKEAIVINNDCGYERIKRVQGMFEGQMVQYKEVIPSNMHKYIWTMSKVAAVIILILACSFIYIQNVQSQVFAYVDLDADYSIAFSIDKKNCVISAKPLTNNSVKVVNYEEMKGMNINKAVSYILAKNKKSGNILSDGDIILISSALNNSQKNDKGDSIKLNETINKLKDTILGQTKGKVPVKAIYASASVRKPALVSNISMGRYVLYSSAVDSGSKITIQEAKAAPLRKLIVYLPKGSSGNVQKDNGPILHSLSDEINSNKSNKDKKEINGTISKAPTAGVNNGQEAKENKSDLNILDSGLKELMPAIQQNYGGNNAGSVSTVPSKGGVEGAQKEKQETNSVNQGSTGKKGEPSSVLPSGVTLLPSDKPSSSTKAMPPFKLNSSPGGMPEGHSEGPAGTPHPPQGHSEGSAGTPQPPQGHSEGPAGTPQLPQGHKEGPAGTPQPPQGHSEGPAGTLQPPQWYPEGPVGTPQPPQGHSEGPAGTPQPPQEHKEGMPEGALPSKEHHETQPKPSSDTQKAPQQAPAAHSANPQGQPDNTGHPGGPGFRGSGRH